MSSHGGQAGIRAPFWLAVLVAEASATFPSSPSTGSAGSLEAALVPSACGCSQEGLVGPGAGCGGRKQLRGCGKTKSGARGGGKSSDYIQQVAIGWGSPGGHGAPGGRVPPHIGRGGRGSGRRLCQLTGWASWAHRRKGTSWPRGRCTGPEGASLGPRSPVSLGLSPGEGS